MTNKIQHVYVSIHMNVKLYDYFLKINVRFYEDTNREAQIHGIRQNDDMNLLFKRQSY